MRKVEQEEGRRFTGYESLHRWSVEHAPQFWMQLWNFCEVIGNPGDRAVEHLEQMPGARFFPDARLNFAENLLRRRDDTPAIIATTERGRHRQMTFRELHRDVTRGARALRRLGVGPGDRVCGIVANVPEAVIAALSTAAIGAVWSSCSPDFGVDAVVDRFGQISPKVLIAVDSYDYAGTPFDCRTKVAEVAAGIETAKTVVLISMDDHAFSWTGPGEAMRWDEWLERETDAPIEFEPFTFDHPLYIAYSSGTTGVPKCLVHRAGGVLVTHLKEHQLQCDIHPGDRMFYFTTCGWMMWNWLISGLASHATLVLYDGSPTFPDSNRLFDFAESSRVTFFGTSAKFIDSIRKAGIRPVATHDLTSVRTITSTGSPLAPEAFDYVYQSIKPDVHFASISGGTDILGCFVGGNPIGPVWRGEIQSAVLAMDVRVFDDTGMDLEREPGELVCGTAFPSMPIGFWGDPDGSKYRAAYFERFPGVWHHGDWIRRTAHGGFIISGRSDATLNPSGVRIGTAELYRQVQQIPEVLDSLAVGQRWDNDERIVLFVRLLEGLVLDADLRNRISSRIRARTSPRHVPARIVQVADIPRTRNGKLAELAVRSVIHGEAVLNQGALANPDALDLYRDLAELRS